MQPAALPAMSPRVRREEIDLEMGLAQTARNDAPSPQHAGARVDARLQDLPQRPARPVPVRAPPVPTGQRIAGHVANVASATAAIVGIASIAPSIIGFFGLMLDKEHMAKYGGIATLAGFTTTGALKAIQRTASKYAHGHNITGRASALGTSRACLDRAVELVTMPDEHERAAHPMREGENNSLAMDLKNLATLPPSRLDPGLWNAARNAGEDAGALIDALLAFRRQSGRESHAAASSSA
ncbi:type III secretion system effector XopAV [Xanthomonas translucens]|uniref:type III secretion system effector XopAV n=1 Tax=Xanthomonas campestris pv. translucens TaxID=343 RepID=UPI001F2B2698|nr:type III secretion system effector XopAV [Xanthomonas translucens]